MQQPEEVEVEKKFSFTFPRRDQTDWYGDDEHDRFIVKYGRKQLFTVSADEMPYCCGMKLLHDYVVETADVELLTKAFAEAGFMAKVREVGNIDQHVVLITMTTRTAQERACIDALIANGWKDGGRGDSTHNEDGDLDWNDGYDYRTPAQKKRDAESDIWEEYEVVLLSKTW